MEFVEIHGFCDCSKQVYSAALYICVKTSSGLKNSLLSSTTKVASMPRLELPGCFIKQIS